MKLTSVCGASKLGSANDFRGDGSCQVRDDLIPQSDGGSVRRADHLRVKVKVKVSWCVLCPW